MKIKILLVFFGLILFFQNCAPMIVKIAGVASSDQKTDPYGAVISEKKHVVSLSHYTEIDLAKGKTIFMMIVQNGGKIPISISSDNIMVIFEGNSKDWASKRINIQSLDEFMKDLEKDYHYDENRTIAGILRIVDMAEDELKAKERAELREKELIVAMVEPKIVRSINEVKLKRKQFEQLEDSVPEIIMKPQTILPNNSISGIVVCDTGELDPKVEGIFRVVVSIDGQEHRFSFTRSL
jgi:hypothetical protein